MSTFRYTNWSPISASTNVYVKNTNSGSAATAVTLNVSGNTVLGSTATQTVKFNADVSSSILPHANCTYNLGSHPMRWGVYGCTGSFQMLMNSASADLIISSSAGIQWHASGNVGIGTSSPSSPAGVSTFLEIADASSAGVSINDTAGTQWDIYSADGRLNFYASVNGSAVANRMAILHDGQVGIGTISPSKTLDVVGTAQISSDLTVGGNLIVNGSTTTIESTTLTVDDKQIEIGTVDTPSDTTANEGGIVLKGATDKEILWKSATSKWTFNNGIHVDAGDLRVDENVGIGITSPDCSLDIARNTGGGGHPFAKLKNHIADTEGSTLGMYKSRNTTIGSHTIVQSGDELGNVSFYGSDGNSFEKFAGIRAKVDGTPGNSDCPGRLEFLTTPDGSNSPSIRMTIKNDGKVEIAGDASIGDDLTMGSDGAIINFGTDSDITLTHAADTSLSLGGAGSTTGLIVNNTAGDGDPFLSFALSGTQTFTMGIDDGDSDKFKIGTTSVNTNTRLTIDSEGKVGIGTHTPASKLDVEGGVSIGATYSGTTAAPTNGAIIEGNVGIGTNNPAMPLHVVDSLGGRVMLHRSNGNTSGQLGSIMFGANDGDTNLAMIAASQDGATDAAYISFETEATTGTIAERMRITSAGKVGIGETIPLGHVHVKTADSGITSVDTKADDLVVESDGNAGISILGGSSHVVGLYFPTSGDADRAYMKYDHSGNAMTFRVAGEDQIQITDGAILPSTDDNVDLGSSTKQFKDAYFDGTVEADAITIGGTTLSETIADTVGAMVGSNTETGIAVTYEDGDNTLDFVLAAAQTTITSLLATDIKIGEDDQTKIDFETEDEIHFYAANVHQVKLTDNMFGPQSDSDVDLGTSSVRWKAGYFDDIYTGDLHLSNERGDWTVIEEEDYLSLRNNKNGKMFKIVMQEILEE